MEADVLSGRCRRLLQMGVFAAIAVASVAASSVGCVSDPRTPVPLAHVALDRMYGDWYIVATIPNSFERGMVAAHDVYSPKGPGVIREDFYMRKGGFGSPLKHYTVTIDVLPKSRNADWRVRPIWPLRLPFQVVYVDPDYRFALFGEQNRRWGWIYSRTPLITAEDYRTLLLEFKALGYDTSLFRRIVQSPAQIGQPGFWSDEIVAY